MKPAEPVAKSISLLSLVIPRICAIILVTYEGSEQCTNFFFHLPKHTWENSEYISLYEWYVHPNHQWIEIFIDKARFALVTEFSLREKLGYFFIIMSTVTLAIFGNFSKSIRNMRVFLSSLISRSSRESLWFDQLLSYHHAWFQTHTISLNHQVLSLINLVAFTPWYPGIDNSIPDT